MPYLVYYDANDFTWSDADGNSGTGLPAEAGFGGIGTVGTANAVAPITITLAADAVPQYIDITDTAAPIDDTLLNENVPSQTFEDSENGDAVTHLSSAYTLIENADGSGRFISGVHTTTDIGADNIYSGFKFGEVQGLVTSVSNPIEPGESIIFQQNVTTIGNEIAYEEYLPCFTKGTLIETASGRKLIEDLEVGDLVWTRDSGMQPIRWIGSRRLGRDELIAQPEFKPVLFPAGSCGNDSDLRVSPEHRMLKRDAMNGVLFGTDEVLISARFLVDGENVVFDETAEEVVYFHILFEKHEIVRANGAESESFHPSGKHSLGLDERARRELFALFPELENSQAAVFAAARPSLKATEFELFKACSGVAV